MSISSSPTEIQPSDEDIDQGTNFKDLGSTVASSGDSEKEWRTRSDAGKELRTWITQANAAFQRLLPVWKSTVYSKKLKIILFQSNVLSVLSYFTSWLKLTAEQEKHLTAFENNNLHRILGISWRDHVSNDEICACICQPDITSAVRQRKQRYLGHILRMPDHRLPKIHLQWQLEGTLHRGRSKNIICRTYYHDKRAHQTRPSQSGRIFMQQRGKIRGYSLTPYVPLEALEELRSQVRFIDLLLLHINSRTLRRTE